MQIVSKVAFAIIGLIWIYSIVWHCRKVHEIKGRCIGTKEEKCFLGRSRRIFWLTTFFFFIALIPPAFWDMGIVGGAGYLILVILVWIVGHNAEDGVAYDAMFEEQRGD